MKLGLLNCYHWDGQADSYQAQYRDMWSDYLSPFLPHNASLTVYELPQGEFPKTGDECDGWIIGGSGKSCYEKDEWIVNLLAWVREQHQAQRKMLGVCFGHQTIAQALGGQVSRSDRGWGVGVRPFRFEQVPDWYAQHPTEWLQNAKLIFSHQDQVQILPAGAERIATNDFCPIQAYTIGQHIFTLQGHPEFTAEFAHDRLDAKEPLIGKKIYDEARATLGEKTHADAVGKMIVAFFSNR